MTSRFYPVRISVNSGRNSTQTITMKSYNQKNVYRIFRKSQTMTKKIRLRNWFRNFATKTSIDLSTTRTRKRPQKICSIINKRTSTFHAATMKNLMILRVLRSKRNILSTSNSDSPFKSLKLNKRSSSFRSHRQ